MSILTNNRNRHLALLALFSVSLVGAPAPQTKRQALYHYYRFVGTNGDSIYFGRVIQLQAWGSHHLLALDSHDGGVYLLDTESQWGQRIGAVGEGPGEYRASLGFGVREDTLAISNQIGTRVSRFLLPAGRYLDDVLQVSPTPGERFLEDSGTYLAAYLPRLRRRDGAFGRFAADGSLLEVFGDYNDAHKYGESRSLQISLNDGFPQSLQDGRLVFAYSSRPIVQVFAKDRRKIAELVLDMPWNSRKAMEPFLSEQTGGWVVRTLISSFQVLEAGFLIGTRGWRGEGTVDQNYVAEYDWNGELRQVIELPSRTAQMGGDEILLKVVRCAGDTWVAVRGDPAIRRLVVY